MGASKRCSLATRRLPSLCMAGVLVLLAVIVASGGVCIKCCCSTLHLSPGRLATQFLPTLHTWLQLHVGSSRQRS